LQIAAEESRAIGADERAVAELAANVGGTFSSWFLRASGNSVSAT